MTDRFGRVPVEAEVAASDGEVGSDGQLLAGPKPEQGAVVADTQPQAAASGLRRPAANLGKQGQFSLLACAQRIGPFRWHT